MAQAYSSNRFTALLAAPLALLVVVVYMARRGAYMSSDRNAMVFFARHRPVVDTLLSTGLMLVVIVVLTGVAVLVEPVTAIGSTVLLLAPFVWILLGAAVFAASSGGALTSPVGPETPQGQRWAVSGLAQLPGTRMSGLVMARGLVDGAPAGAVVVAVAATDGHLRTYRALGFCEGRQRRVYRAG